MQETNLIDIVQSQLSEDMIGQLSRQIGSTPQQTQVAASSVIATLVTALSKNTEKPGGIDALVSAVDRDHDGSILDDAMGFLLGNKKPANTNALNGSGILRHVLGGKQEAANDVLSKLTGLDKGAIAQLMITLAPMVLAAIGKARHKQGLTPQGIGDLLSGTVRSQTQQRTELGLLGRFLDRDGDGSVMDDLMDIGMKAFLNRKKP